LSHAAVGASGTRRNRSHSLTLEVEFDVVLDGEHHERQQQQQADQPLNHS